MEATWLVLDTDVVIDHLRRSKSVLPLALKNYGCAITAITQYELKAVVHLPDVQQTLLNDILQHVFIEPFDGDAAERSAHVWRQLAQSGELISAPDILTAGICLVQGLPLLTRNVAHYSRIAGLQLISPEELQSRSGAA